MKSAIKKHGMEIARDVLCVVVFLIAVLTGGETARLAPFAIALLLLISAGLICLRETRYLTLPFLLLTLLFIFCYDSFSVFIRYVWLVPIPVFALVWHVVRLRPRFCAGTTFPPLTAVAIATMLGGIGMIPVADYFRPASLGFMAGLGPVLVLSYLLLKNTVKSEVDREMLAEDLLRWGLVAAAIVFWYNVPLFLQNGVGQLFRGPQWSNNIGTMLMLAMPAALAVKNRKLIHYGFAFLMFLAGMFSCSRGAQVFIGFEFLLTVFWGWRTETAFLKRLWSRTFFLLTLLAMGYLFTVLLFNIRLLGYLDPNETRWDLLFRGFEDFKQNPLFGSGLGYRGNADLYSGKQGTINWYHISVAQIVGGLGLVGTAAWLWQLAARARVARYAWRDKSFGFALCYLGLFLMSLVNPGEFCPVPYAFLAVYFFVAIEGALAEQGIVCPTPLARVLTRVRALIKKKQAD